jgi:hypothetical protein
LLLWVVGCDYTSDIDIVPTDWRTVKMAATERAVKKNEKGKVEYLEQVKKYHQ